MRKTSREAPPDLEASAPPGRRHRRTQSPALTPWANLLAPLRGVGQRALVLHGFAALKKVLQRETIQKREPGGEARQAAGDHEQAYRDDKSAARKLHGVEMFFEAAIKR